MHRWRSLSPADAGWTFDTFVLLLRWDSQALERGANDAPFSPSEDFYQLHLSETLRMAAADWWGGVHVTKMGLFFQLCVSS